MRVGRVLRLVLFATAGMMVHGGGQRPDRRSSSASRSCRSALYVLAGIFAHPARGRRGRDEVLPARRVRHGLLLYGIALLYGATGSTNLDRIGAAVAAAPARDPLLLIGFGLLAGRLRLQGLGGAVPHVDARRLRGRPDPGDRASWPPGQGRGLRRAGPRAARRRFGRSTPTGRGCSGRLAGAHDDGRQRGRARPDERQAHARVLDHRPRRLHAGRHRRRRRRRRRRACSSTCSPTRSRRSARSASIAAAASAAASEAVSSTTIAGLAAPPPAARRSRWRSSCSRSPASRRRRASSASSTSSAPPSRAGYIWLAVIGVLNSARLGLLLPARHRLHVHARAGGRRDRRSRRRCRGRRSRWSVAALGIVLRSAILPAPFVDLRSGGRFCPSLRSVADDVRPAASRLALRPRRHRVPRRGADPRRRRGDRGAAGRRPARGVSLQQAAPDARRLRGQAHAPGHSGVGRRRDQLVARARAPSARARSRRAGVRHRRAAADRRSCATTASRCATTSACGGW